MSDNFNENNNNVQNGNELNRSFNDNDSTFNSYGNDPNERYNQASNNATMQPFIPDPNANSYAYTSENAEKQPKKKSRHIVLKATAFVLCLAIVGAGSIQGYKFLKETRSELTEFQADSKSAPVQKTKNSPPVSSSSDDDMPSFIELASRTDAKPIPDIVDEIMPSVVGVSSTFEITYSGQSFGMFGWGNSEPQTQESLATGTGFVITEDGYIVTNAHVIYDDEYKSGEATEVSVLFSDETEQEASIVAYDIETDIAVLKVNQTGLTPATLGDSDELRVGELVIAIGNPLGFDLFGSVTSGIVSAVNRQISINEKNMTLIQTDAAINSGNSGGPLLNSCGQVIGINSAKMSSSYGSASVEGLGFAIPIRDAKDIIDDLINYKYVKGRPQIGISTTDVTEAYSRYFNIPIGVYVRAVNEGSAADLAGIQVGDVIIGIEGEAVATADELNEIKNQYKAGDTITLTITRSEEDMEIELTLQEAVSDTSDEDEEEETEPEIPQSPMDQVPGFRTR